MLVSKLRNYLEPLLILTLSILIFATIYNIYLLQGTARVVNYTGLVRGPPSVRLSWRLQKNPMMQISSIWIVSWRDYKMVAVNTI